MEFFAERQRFRQWWIWLTLLVPTAVGWLGFVVQIVFGNQFGDQPAPDWVVILVWLVFGIGFPWFMLALALETRVDAGGVHLRFRPFRGRTFPFDSIVSAVGGTYRPLREFGGWGVRWGGKGKRAYSVSGKQRVEVTLDDGTAWTIGTQRPDEFELVVTAHLPPR